MKSYLLKDKFTDVQFLTDLKILHKDHDHILFIIDQDVHKLFPELVGSVTENYPCYLIRSEEKVKDLSTVTEIYKFLQKHKANRSSVICGIGGGIVTDIAGFAASTYMRGCRLKLVPTTLLAMVDAAIGGKTAVNFSNFKNNIGTFFPAEEVIIIPDLLQSLPDVEYRNGLAECIKISLVKPGDLYDLLLDSEQKVTRQIIEKAMDLKFSLCTLDPEDKNERRVLNLGHTFGHVLETLTGFTIPHGLAIALGIRAAAHLSLEEGLISQVEYEKTILLLNKFDFPSSFKLTVDLDKNKVEEILRRDKKSSYVKGEPILNLVVFKGFQQAVVRTFPVEKVYWELQQILTTN